MVHSLLACYPALDAFTYLVSDQRLDCMALGSGGQAIPLFLSVPAAKT